MCGIAGLIGQFKDYDAVAFTRALSSLSHRGPDGEGVYRSGGCWLGHRRLKIIDLSEDGRQPMSNEDGTIWITFNGEIYNFEELRPILEGKGHAFRSHTDTEVIPHLYEEYGIDCLQRLNGMFAFCLLDERRREALLVRDRLGVKPLFYMKTNSGLAFASEIKALLYFQLEEHELDVQALSDFLSLNYVVAPRTLFKQIRQLLPGEALLVSTESGKVQHLQYWDLSFEAARRPADSELLGKLDELLDDAVRLRLKADVPFGAFLSGGLDSSVVVSRMVRQNSAATKTFTISFNEPSYDESRYAEMVSLRLNTDHYVLRMPEVIPSLLEQIVWHAEEPTADSSMIPLYCLSQLTRQEVTMVLSGDGGDEIFAGYPTYLAHYLAEIFSKLPEVGVRLVSALAERWPVSDKKVSFDFKLKRFVRYARLSAPERHMSWRIIFDENAKRRMFSRDFFAQHRPGAAFQAFRDYFDRSGSSDFLDQMQYVDIRAYLPNDILNKVDRMTMAHSLEARAPFLDYRIAELVATVRPRDRYFPGGDYKRLLRSVSAGSIPAKILKRRKRGFNVAKSIWFRGPLREFVCDEILGGALLHTGILQRDPVERLLKEHLSGSLDHGHQIYSLLVLSIWLRKFNNFRKVGVHLLPVSAVAGPSATR